MNDVETNLIKEVRNSDTNHNHPPLFTLWNVCISYLQASWHKEALKKNQQKHVLLLSVFLSWHSIDNSYISSQNPILHNYNILLKSRRCMVRFLSLPAAPDLGDMQSETSPAKSISVHQGTQHFICHSYCHVNPKSHNVLYYWRGGDKDMPLQTLPFVTNKKKKKEKKKEMKLYNKHLNATFETLTSLGTMVTVRCGKALWTLLPAEYEVVGLSESLVSI